MLKHLLVDRKKVALTILILGLFFLVWVAGCSQQAEQPPEDTLTPAPTPYGITYCDIQPGDFCLEGFGLEDEDKMLILLKADDRTYASIFALMEQKEGEFYLECLKSETFLENVYCQGEAVPDGEKIDLFFYSTFDGNMLAKGAFIVYYGDIQEPDVVFGLTPTVISTDLAKAETSTPTSPRTASPTPRSAYPNPSPRPNSTSTTAPSYPH